MLGFKITCVFALFVDCIGYVWSCKTKEQNIGNHGYIGTWILRIYRKISVDILTKISVMQKLTKIL